MIRYNHLFFFSLAYPISGMITVPVSSGTYQAVLASMQQGGGITFHTTENLASNGNTIQLISTPLQLANGQIIAKIETDSDARQQQQSISSLVTKVMGQQSIHAEQKPATLTITPVGSSSSSTSTSESIIHMVGSGSSRLRSRSHQVDQPDTTESLD